MVGRVLLALGLAAALLTGGALTVLRTDLVSNNLCGYAVATIEEATEARVRVARCTVDPAQGRLTIEGLEAASPDGRLKFSVVRVFVQLVVRPLQQRLRLERLEIDHPEVEVVLGGAPSTRPKSDRCLPPTLEGFELGRVRVRKARVLVSDPASGLRVDVPRATALLKGEGTAVSLHLATRGGAFELGPRAAGLISTRLGAHVDLRGVGAITLDKADVIGTEASVFATGKLEDFCVPRLEANANVRVDELGVLTDRLLPGTLRGVKGSVAGDASVDVAKGKVHVRGDLRTKALALEGFLPGDVRARFDLTPERLKVEKLEIAVGAKGSISGDAELGLAGDGLPLTADLQLHDMELAELLHKLGLPGAWVVLRSSGKVAAKGTLLPLQLQGSVALDLAEFAVLDRRHEQRARASRALEFARGRLQGAVAVDAERVQLRSGTLDVERSRLFVDGTFYTDFQKGLDLRGRADGFALEDFRGHLGPIPWRGKATLTVGVKGPYTGPLIEGLVGVRAFHFLDLSLGEVAAKVRFQDMLLNLDEIAARKDRSTYGGRVALDFGPKEMPVDAHIEVSDAWLHDLIDLAVGLVPTLSPMNDAKDVDGHVTGVIDAKGPVASPDGKATMAFDQVRLWGQTFADGDAAFTLHGSEPRLQIEHLLLRHGQALLKMEGRFGPRWELEMDARTEAFDLADLDSGAAARLKGPLLATTKVRGVASHPLVDVDVAFTGGQAGKAPLGDAAVALRVDGKEMRWRGTVGTHALEGRARLKDDFGYTSTLQLRFPDLSGYFASFVPEAELGGGSASASVALSGSLLKWRESEAAITLAALKFTRGDLTFENDGTGEVLFGPRGLEIKRLALRSLFTRATLQGTRGADGRLDLHCSANIDGRVLQGLVPDLEHAAGQYLLQASLAGTSASPAVLGNLRVEGGELRLRGLPLSLRELNGSVSFSQDALVIDEMAGKVNNGLATVTGGMQMKALKPARVAFELKMSDVAVKLSEALGMTLDGELALSGPPLEPLLGGNLIVSRMRYAEDLDITRSLLDFNKRPPAPKVLTKSAVLVHFDVDVHLSRGVRVENNLARADLKGDLKVTGTSRSLGLLGSVNAVRGTAAFRGNEFQIEQGVVSFTDRQRIRPSFDFQAFAQVKEYKVRMHAFGTPAEPHLTLASEPALAEADLGFLLTFGFVSSNLQQANFSAADSGLALGVEALNKMTGFSEEVRRFIPKNAILRDPTIDFVSDFSQASGGGRLEPMARFRSHVVSDRVDLRLMEGLSTRRYRGVLNYQLTDAMSGQLQIDNEKKNVGTDFGFDLKLRWEGE